MEKILRGSLKASNKFLELAVNNLATVIDMAVGKSPGSSGYNQYFEKYIRR